MPRFSKYLRSLLWGDPFDDVWPRRSPPDPPTYNGRVAALGILRLYLSELTFFRVGDRHPITKTRGEKIPVVIPKERIFVEWPDAEVELKLPSLALLGSGANEYDAIGFVNYVEEDTVDKYAPGTVLIWMSEHQETFALEIWAETKQERRAIIAGIEQAMSPLQQMSGLRFRMPDYYDQLVTFSLDSCELIDDEESVRIRRRARMSISMRFNVVALVNATTMELVTETQVDVDEDTLQLVQEIEDGELDDA